MKKRGVETGKHGMVASSQPLASQIGLEILKQGGTAVDAAIAVNAALGLMEPHMCGIGGDLFAIVWDAHSEQLTGLNAGGRSPQGLSYAALLKRLQDDGRQKIPMEGVLPVSVPGAVAGWYDLHQRFGSMPVASLLQPAIDHAEKGFPLTPIIAEQWHRYAGRLSSSLPGDFRRVYLPDGRAPAAGETFCNPQLAESYRLIAKEGSRGFYQGEMAARIDAFMSGQGAYLSRRDLAAHESTWVTPLSVKYRDYDIYELPPNGQGLATLQMLTLLQRFDLASLGALNPESIHLMVEAKKLVFEDRARFYCDPDFGPTPVAALLSDVYRDERAALISEHAARQVCAGDPLLQQSDTVYLTTADRAGNMVSLIQSIFHPFGSGVVVPGTGFALQNRGMSFSPDPAHPNVYAAAKRPFHTIIPAFVMREGKPFMSFGVMGGDMQPQGQVQVISNILDFNMDIQAAGDAPRWRHEGSTQPTDNAGGSLADGGELMLEQGFPESLIQDLSQRGHRVTVDKDGQSFGGYQAIMCDGRGGYLGASDRRKDGCAAAY